MVLVRCIKYDGGMLCSACTVAARVAVEREGSLCLRSECIARLAC